MCTATNALHGGLVLYNGGLTAGITALILLPILEHYLPEAREEMPSSGASRWATIAVVANPRTDASQGTKKQG